MFEFLMWLVYSLRFHRGVTFAVSHRYQLS